MRRHGGFRAEYPSSSCKGSAHALSRRSNGKTMGTRLHRMEGIQRTGFLTIGRAQVQRSWKSTSFVNGTKLKVQCKSAELDGYGGIERMEQSNFETLLREKIGLDAASVGRDTVERAVKLRMRSCGVLLRDDYWERLQTSSDELQELIEAIVVPETWFFRDREAFEALGHLVVEGRSVAQAGANLRLLSAPCSTGEEPYAI